MNHLGLILVREYLNKIRNKSFIIMTFMSPLLMVGVIGLVTYLSGLNNDNERHIKILLGDGNEGKSLQSRLDLKAFVLQYQVVAQRKCRHR